MRLWKNKSIEEFDKNENIYTGKAKKILILKL